MKKAIIALALAMIAIAPAIAQMPSSYNSGYDDGSVSQIVSVPVRPRLNQISSPGTFRAWVISQVTNGSTYVFGQGIGLNPYLYVNSGSPSEIMSALSSAELAFTMLDPNHDIVGVAAQLSDDMGFTRFYSSRYGERPVNGRIPRGQIRLEMLDEQPIWVGEDYYGAEMYYRDADGYIDWQDYMNVYDGWLYFKGKYAGQRGHLVLKSESGSDTVIDVQSGYEVILQLLHSSQSVGLTNYFELSAGVGVGPLGYTASATASNSPKDSPVVRVQLDRVRDVVVSAQVTGINNSVLEVPTIVYITSTDGSITEAPVGASVRLDAGVYFFSFGWEVNFSEAPAYPYWGGGKG